MDIATKNYKQENLQLKGMDCPDCATTIEHLLNRLPGVVVAKVSYVSQLLRIEIDPDVISVEKIIKQLKRFGYIASQKELPESWWRENYELFFSILSGLLLFCSWVLGKWWSSVSLPLDLLAFVSGGWLTLRDSLQTLMQKRFDIEVLMLVAAIGAGVLGQWGEGALLLFLFSLGHALEHRAMERARQAVKALADLAPKTALVKRNNTEIEIPVEELLRGDLVIVRPGQRIPIDGTVKEGNSSVDQASITGESMPVDKKPGDAVFAGTINSEGTLTIIVDKLADETTLSRMVRMVMEAETQQSPTQRFTDKFVRYFVPAVLIGVVLLIFLPPLFGATWSSAFYRAISVLVAASPCALAIATPAAVLSGVARAAQLGVLIKGGMHLENLGTIQAIAFDKTGTLTKGKPEVQKIIALNSDKDVLLTVAASIENLSLHPLAKAVVNAALQKNIVLKKVENFKSITGKGLQGEIDNKLILVGSFKLFENIPDAIQQQMTQLQEQGNTVVIVQYDQAWLGLIGIADTIRPEAKEALAQLKNQHIQKTIMLTGDNQRVAQAIANKIGITEIRADLLPEDKLTVIKELQQREKVAMVGDGVNDAPALAQATVGIAMGGAGTDVALETADVALMADDLSKLSFAVSLSRKAAKIIQQNLIISLSVVGVLIIGALTGYTGLGIAVAVHEGSTLIVVGNALRLLRHVQK